jgi:hypothetical protein
MGFTMNNNRFIRVQVDLGDIGEKFLGIFYNTISNKITLIDEIGSDSDKYKSFLDKVLKIIRSGSPFVFRAKSKEYFFEIELKIADGTFITLYPIAPFKKKNINTETQELDLGFYIERMIELTENFSIYELVTG